MNTGSNKTSCTYNKVTLTFRRNLPWKIKKQKTIVIVSHIFESDITFYTYYKSEYYKAIEGTTYHNNIPLAVRAYEPDENGGISGIPEWDDIYNIMYLYDEDRADDDYLGSLIAYTKNPHHAYSDIPTFIKGFDNIVYGMDLNKSDFHYACAKVWKTDARIIIDLYNKIIHMINTICEKTTVHMNENPFDPIKYTCRPLTFYELNRNTTSSFMSETINVIMDRIKEVYNDGFETSKPNMCDKVEALDNYRKYIENLKKNKEEE